MGTLAAAAETIGEDGVGLFQQTGGENVVSGDLLIGQYEDGAYELSNGVVTAGNLVVGAGSIGNFSIQNSDAQIIVSNQFMMGRDGRLSCPPGAAIQLRGTAFDLQGFWPEGFAGLRASLVLSNPGPAMLYASRVLLLDMPAGAQAYDATGIEKGDSFLLSGTPLAPGESVEFTVEIYVPDRTVPAPSFVADVAIPAQATEVTGMVLMIERALVLPDVGALIEFPTEEGRTYYIQYSEDMAAWKTAVPAVIGTGSRMQWIDRGPPKTDHPPSNEPSRYYRVLLTP